MSTSEKPNETRQIAEKLLLPLREISGYEFTLNWFPSPVSHWTCVRKEPDYPVRTSDGKEIGIMFRQAEFRHVYFDNERRVKWPDDWIDPYRVSIDRVSIYDDHAEVSIRKDFDCDFVCKAYYAIAPIVTISHSRYGDFSTVMLSEMEDRIKAIRFMPGAVKDIEAFLKSIREVFPKYGIQWSQAEYDFSTFGLVLKFPTHDLNHRDITENVINRAVALTEHRKRFRLEWLPCEKRRDCYESTMLFRDDPFRKSNLIRYICKFPFLSKDEQLNAWVEEVVKHHLAFRYRPQVYTLDGNRLRLVDYEVYKDEQGVERLKGGRIIVGNNDKLEPFTLEQIEFLKEDFPGLWA